MAKWEKIIPVGMIGFCAIGALLYWQNRPSTVALERHQRDFEERAEAYLPSNVVTIELDIDPNGCIDKCMTCPFDDIKEGDAF